LDGLKGTLYHDDLEDAWLVWNSRTKDETKTEHQKNRKIRNIYKNRKTDIESINNKQNGITKIAVLKINA